METWFRTNLNSEFQYYDSLPINLQDNPTAGIGLHSVWDPENKRILLTYKDFIAKPNFIAGYELPTFTGGSINWVEDTQSYAIYSHTFPIPEGAPSLEHYIAIQSGDYPVIPPSDIYNDYTILSVTPIYFANPTYTNLTWDNNIHWMVYTPTAGEIGNTITALQPDVIMNGPDDEDTYTPQWEHIYYSPTDVSLYEVGEWGYTPIAFNDTQYFTPTGWTISYYPESKLWGSFHSYVPYKYFNTHSNIYSVTHQSYEGADQVIWEHGKGDYGSFYNGRLVPFIFEFINNGLAAADTLTYSLSYTADTIKNEGNLLEAGFSSVLFYNSMQMSNNISLDYLVTTRKIGNSWKINKFRDMSKRNIYTNSYYDNGLLNVAGELTDSVTSTAHIPMFNVSGMHEVQNSLYLNLEKPWNLQKKFVDKWIGIRLICDNTRNNLVNLYSAVVGARKYNR
jgi:hypothetical protein